MRIEVEVYKGSLSKEPQLQLADLLGYLEEAKTAFTGAEEFVYAVTIEKTFKGMTNEGMTKKTWWNWAIPSFLLGNVEHPEKFKFLPTDPEDVEKDWCKDVEPAWDFFVSLDFYDCFLLKRLYLEGKIITKSIETTYDSVKDVHSEHPYDKEKVKNTLIDISHLAGVLKAISFSWAVATTSGQSLNITVRIAAMNFVVAAAEYSNLIQAKADALYKQIDGHDRIELPLSVQVRDTDPTDFVHLFDWNDASLYQWLGPIKVADRVKIISRLFSDQNWSKINTVHASGWGHVSMALIKDDIGNWNLKNFGNNPGKLLTAYTEVAKRGLEKAAEIAAEGLSGGKSGAVNKLGSSGKFVGKSLATCMIEHRM